MYLLEDHLFRATLLLRGAMGATRETFPGVLCDNLTPPLVARKIYYIARTICLQSMGNVANLAKYTHIVHIGTACIYIHIYIYTYACTCLYVYITKFLHIVNPHIEISLIACSKSQFWETRPIIVHGTYACAYAVSKNQTRIFEITFTLNTINMIILDYSS